MTGMSDTLKRDLGILPDSVDEDGVILNALPPVMFVPKHLSTEFEEDTSDKATDYRKVRETLHELLEVTSQALAGALDVANETMHPRAYEIANNIANTVRETGKDILAIHKDMESKKKSISDIPNGANITQNNFYGMTTQEVIAAIKEQKKNEKDISKGNIIDVE